MCLKLVFFTVLLSVLQVYASDKYEMAFKNNKAVLIIHGSEIDDSGVYRCEAVNKIGLDETEARLTVYSKRPLAEKDKTKTKTGAMLQMGHFH